MTADKTYEIWCEGYNATGTSSEATLFGTAEGADFKAACKAFAATKNDDFRRYFDPINMTYWGCRLFDNEADARKAFG